MSNLFRVDVPMNPSPSEDNVIANTKSITDEQLKNKYLTESSELIKKTKNFKRKVIKTINNK